MMASSKLKQSGSKIGPHSDFREAPDLDEAPCNKMLRAKKQNILKIATWNVRSLGVVGKLENLLIEMKRLSLEIVGISEVRWKNQGDYWNEGYRIIHSGDEKGKNGVGVILNKDWGNRVKNVVLYNNRIILVRLQVNESEVMNVIQCYMPTGSYDDEAVENVYEQIDDVWEMIGRNEKVIVLGDWNAAVGSLSEENVTGKYGYGRRNSRGDRLIEFCKEKELVIANTLFQQPMNRRYTWTKPGGVDKYQIDYIMIRRSQMKYALQCKTYPGADIYTDHNLVFMKMRLDTKRKIRRVLNIKKYNSSKLKEPNLKMNYQEAVKEKIKEVQEIPTDIDGKWNIIKSVIKEAASETLGILKNAPRKPWITEYVIELIEERRKYKNAKTIEDKIKYKHWRNVVNREAKRAKENWLGELHKEIEEDLKRGKVDKAYNMINKYFGQRKMKVNTIEDENRKLLFEDREIAKRWKSYVENLYDDNEELKELEEEQEDNSNEITRGEFDEALKRLKPKKACGIDEVPAELIQALDEGMMELLYLVTKEIYETGEIPQDFQVCKMVMLPKKIKSKKCEDFRTLSLLSHASKILTSIVKRRIQERIDSNLDHDQFGFRTGKGTREAILALRLIAEESMRVNQPLFIAFVDLQKAFDNVNWSLMMKILKDIGVEYRDRRIIFNLYRNQSMHIEINQESEKAKIKKGVRQGCNISPYLFNIYIEKAIEECKECCTGIVLNGVRIQMLRFADDIALLAPDEFNLKRSLECMNEVLAEYKMKMNMTKTEILVSKREAETVNIRVNGCELKQSKSFKYLGSNIAENAKSVVDIKQRIAQAKAAFMKKYTLFCSNNINIHLRKQLIKTLVWSIALYGSETWVIGMAERKKIEAFEMWCWRKMNKIKWTERMSNERVLQMVGERRQIMNMLEERRHRWIGHLYRHNDFMVAIIEGKRQGSQGRGRPRERYIDQIVKYSGSETYADMKRKTSDRVEWRAINQS
ncbi:hypothetical protein M8J77_018806 [Diaphorina citri]|nr:hypothetical protein M8J77_018806 [Diaphorina citri]